MVERKTLNKLYRLVILLSAGIFSLISFSSITLAVNYGSGVYNSDLYSATIPSATAAPIAGTYPGTQSITLTTAGGNTIRYTTSATPANCSSGTLYTAPIQVSTSQTIYTLTCDTYGNSTPASFTYTISIGSSGSGNGGFFNPVFSSKPAISTSTNTAPALIRRNISIKSRGADVKALQKYLKSRGYSITTIDGVFGPQTKSAVISFQKGNNLHPDGIVGTKTRKMLNIGIIK